MPRIAIGPQVRKSPFFERTLAAGATHFTVYNHMYMPVSYGDPAAEYERLVNGVAVWDVAVERQVELAGPDAEALARVLTTRDLGAMETGQSRYAPMCNRNGSLINDPVLLPVEPGRVWLSIADRDIGLWAEAVAEARGLRVDVDEPDVSPLAVQGPKAEAVIAHLAGDWVRELRHFGFRPARVDGIDLLIARSGWSKQGGFELYLRDGRHGPRLWDLVMEAGKRWEIGPGAPNRAERIESGLLSVGADTDAHSDPFELGLERYVDLEQATAFVGKAALKAIAERGPARRRVGFFLDGTPMAIASQHRWPLTADGRPAGYISAAAYSPRVNGGDGGNIAVGLVTRELARQGNVLDCDSEFGPRRARVTELPFEVSPAA